jgi:4'-phosphopantetheinyl transferase
MRRLQTDDTSRTQDRNRIGERENMSEDFPPPELPAKDTIHLWWIDLDSLGHADAAPAALLSPAELEHAARFHFARDAARYRLCRAMLRMGLGWYLGRNPREIELRTGKFGKPYVTGANLFFNVAHSAGLGVIAFSTRSEVGVDVEAADRPVEVMDIASSYFTARETALIATAHEPEQLRAFLRIWTRKEAVLKAVGCGIPNGLNRVDVIRGLVTFDGEEITPGNYGKSEWLVRDLTPREGFAGAIAASPGDWAIEHWQAGWENARTHLQARLPGTHAFPI